MRVKISYTIDAPEFFRRAIRHYRGEGGLATREEVRDWMRLYGESMNQDIAYDLNMEKDKNE